MEVRRVELREVVAGLKFPEGPLALPEGGLLFVECWRGTLSRVTAAGEYSVVVDLGHRPASVAKGPDGRYYVCNDGGLNERETQAARAAGEDPGAGGVLEPGGGCIQVVDLDLHRDLHLGPEPGRDLAPDGDRVRFETLYDQSEGWPIGAANDLVFDEWGGFYFTDFVKRNHRMATRGRICYALPDGSLVKDVVAPIDTPNGIGLSPDGKTLYVAQADHARLWAFDVEGPGQVRSSRGMDRGGRLLCTLPGVCGFDSLGVDAEGYVCVATTGTGRMTVVAPDGSAYSQIDVGDPHVTNICWGGPDWRTAYITLGGAGKIVATHWERPGLPLHFLDRS